MLGFTMQLGRAKLAATNTYITYIYFFIFIYLYLFTFISKFIHSFIPESIAKGSSVRSPLTQQHRVKCIE